MDQNAYEKGLAIVRLKRILRSHLWAERARYSDDMPFTDIDIATSATPEKPEVFRMPDRMHDHGTMWFGWTAIN